MQLIYCVKPSILSVSLLRAYTLVWILCCFGCSYQKSVAELLKAISDHPGCTAASFHEESLGYLKYYSDGISAGDIDLAEKMQLDSHRRTGVRIRIVNNRLFYRFIGEPAGVTKLFLFFAFQVLLCKHRVPDVDFVLNVADAGTLPLERFNITRAPPIFSWTRAEPSSVELLMPYSLGLPGLRHDVVSFINRTTVPWSERVSQAVFRGSTTGAFLPSPDRWRRTQRGRLVMACSTIPNICDAGFTHVAGFANEEVRRLMLEDMQRINAFKSPIPLGNQTRYKYIIAADGNGPPSSRIVQVLLSGAVVIKFLSRPDREFFYPQLTPWRHYVPLSQPEDIVHVLEWLRTHDDEARQIGEYGRQFALQYLNPDYLECFLLDLLYGYASLQQFEPKVPNDSDADREFKPLDDLMDDKLKSDINRFLHGSCPLSSVTLR